MSASSGMVWFVFLSCDSAQARISGVLVWTQQSGQGNEDAFSMYWAAAKRRALSKRRQLCLSWNHSTPGG